jgi:hypothetical protein
MSSRRLLALSLILPGLAVAGCGDAGPQRTEVREVDAFSRVDVDGSTDVRIRVGGARSVKVRAPESIVGDVRTDVTEGVLRIERDDDAGFTFGDDGPVVVEVTTPSLEELLSEGSSDIKLEGVRGKSLFVRLSGSGDLTARGSVERLDVRVSGSGDLELSDLRTTRQRLEISGSGDADVRADEALEVVVSGSGDVRYRGGARVTRRVDGSGDVGPA